MGFYINEYDVNVKQHVNLSNYAWSVIDEDIINFNNSLDKASFSGFLNTVFKNFYQKSDASISLRNIELLDKLNSLYNLDKKCQKDKLLTNSFITTLINFNSDNLIKRVKSYPKDEGRKFRLNKDSVEILKESIEVNNYTNSIGLYLKAIYEDYALKPTYIRERIYYKDFIDLIENSINLKKKLKVTLIDKLTNSDEIVNRRFYISPYKIKQDKNNMFNYLVCYSEEILDNGEILDKKLTSFRISRFKKIDIMSSMNSFISKENIKRIEDSLLNNDVQYLVSDLMDIKVKFTNKGLESFNRQIYMRPNNFEIVDNNTILFKCSEIQAVNYFFKFGKNIEIIEPKSLRDKFIYRYSKALDIYIRRKIYARNTCWRY